MLQKYLLLQLFIIVFISACASEGDIIYVSYTPDMVCVINTADNTVLKRIKVGQLPQGIAFSPDGKFCFVANAGSNDVSIIETEKNEVVHTVPVGKKPQDVVVPPCGRFAFVSCYDSDEVSVIPCPGTQLLTSIKVGSKPMGICVTKDGGFVCVANSESGTVSLISVDTLEVEREFFAGKSPMAVASIEGDLLLVADSSGFLRFLDLRTGKEVDRISVNCAWGIGVR